jgi:hypothetical protein
MRKSRKRKKKVTKKRRPAIPQFLIDQLSELEFWAMDNKQDARLDAIRFWVLKIPAILVAASAGIFAHLDMPIVTLAAGAIASLCVLIDGLHPGGMLRNVHHRACHDLRNLQNDIGAHWRAGILDGEDSEKLAAKIIREIQVERKRIAGYLRDAETQLGVKR